MPKVGSKHFSYDQSGVQKAQAEAERTGLPLEHEDRNYAQYNEGGKITARKSRERASEKEKINRRLQKHINEGEKSSPPGGKMRKALSGIKNPLKAKIGNFDLEVGRNPGDIGMTLSTDFQKGGSVRGVGKAQRGFGKAMK